MEKISRDQYTHAADHFKNGKKILFANVPADGHFNPLSGLAVYLQQQGYDVRWYSASLYADKITKLGIPYYPFKRALEVTGENMDSMFPERKTYKTQISKLRFDMINYFLARSTEYFADIQEIYESFRFDLMISDVAFSAIPFVKEKMNIPVVSIGVVPLVETSRDLAPSGLGLMPSQTVPGRIKQALLRFVADRVLFKKPAQFYYRLLRSHGIDPNGANVFDILVQKSTLLLQTGTPGFEYHRSDLSSNIRFIGPLLPHQPTTARTPWFSEKLSQFEKVVLVTQGTIEKDVNKLLVPTLEAYKDSEYLVVATTGGSQTKELQEKYAYDNVIIEDFIPFADVLPYTDVYITNGGYGGVMMSINHGIPMVVAGIHEGKNEINARIGYFKLGLNLGTESPTPVQIMRHVEEVLYSDVFRENVQQLRREFSRYDAPALCATYIADLLDADATESNTGAWEQLPQRLVVY